MSLGAVPISLSATVDIGGGRGRLAPNPAASLARIDAQLGRLADVNDAWRSPEVADENRRKWLAYQNGTGPIAPYALDRWGSIHCRGYAADSDDWYDAAAAAVWERNGWRQTAMYPVGDSRREPWHGEYDEARDQYLGQPAGSGATNFPAASIHSEVIMNVIKLVDGGGFRYAVTNGIQWQEGQLDDAVQGANWEEAFGPARVVDGAAWDEAKNIVALFGGVDMARAVSAAQGANGGGAVDVDKLAAQLRDALGDQVAAAVVDKIAARIATETADEQDRRARERLS